MRIILVALSARYVRSEWQKYFAEDPTGADRKLVPVRVGECDVKSPLKQSAVSGQRGKLIAALTLYGNPGGSAQAPAPPQTTACDPPVGG